MLFVTIIQHYLLWHYTSAYAEMFHVFKNFLWFLGHFFSIRHLTRTLFAPFKRITEERRKAWDLEDWAGRIFINLLSRIIGALVRGSVLVFGLGSIIGTTVIGLIVFALWFFAPLIIIVSLIAGVVYLFL